MQKRKLLLITESSECKAFKKFFPDWEVYEAISGGHVKEMDPEDGIDWDTLSPKLRWIPKAKSGPFKDFPSKKELVKKINDIGNKVDEIWLLLDQDFEGCNISKCIYDELTPANKKKAIRREMNDWSKDSIQKNIIDNNKPDKIEHKYNNEFSWMPNYNSIGLDNFKVAASQWRGVLDMLMGYSLSRYIWSKVSGARSLGRVQSPPLVILLKNEQDIANFKERKSVGLDFLIHTDNPKQDLPVDLIKLNPKFKLKENTLYVESDEKSKSKIIKFNDKKELQEYKNNFLAENKFKLETFEKTETTQNPPMLFDTNAFCKYASSKFGYKIKDIMEMLQKLYENSLCSYTRTDSTKADPAFIKKTIELFKKDKSLANDLNIQAPEDYYFQKTQKGSQEGHFFLGPVDMSMTPEDAKAEISQIKSKYDASKLEKIYEALYLRTKLAFFKPAKSDSYKLIFDNNDSKFQGGFSILTYAGWKNFIKEAVDKDESKFLPSPYKKSETYQASNFSKDTCFKLYTTKPPRQMSWSILLDLLKKHGVGRPSYYKTMSALLEDRGYVTEKSKKLYLTDLGRKVALEATAHLNSLINLTFSKEILEIMDRISQGENIYRSEMLKFLKTLNKCLTENGMEEWNATTSKEKNKSVSKKPVELTNLTCPKCGKPLKKVEGKFGVFFSCTGYPKCDYSQKSDKQVKTHKCPKCGKVMVDFEWTDKKTGKKRISRKCLNPKCKFVDWDPK